MHAILWCSKFCDCNKDEYGKMKWGVVSNHPLLWEHDSNLSAELCSILGCSWSLCRDLQWSQVLSKSPADWRRGLLSSHMSLLYQPNLVASWKHLHKCRCFQEQPRILLQSLRALCLAPAGPGSIWKYLEALVRSPRVAGRFAGSFQTDLHFTDAKYTCQRQDTPNPTWL